MRDSSPRAGVAHLSDVFGRRTVYAVGLVGTGLFAFPYFGLVDTTNARLVVPATAVALFLHDLQYGSQATLIAEGLDARLRSSGGGLGYQLGSVGAGGPAPLIAAALLQRPGSSTVISAYIVGCSAISPAALALMPRADRVIDSQSHDRAVVVADTTPP
ncbi:hypothetical protein [Streptomyces spiralis]